MSLELILIRHGAVPGIDPPRFRGRTDLALTDLGKAQALAMGEWVREHFTVTAIHASPLSRCIDTANAIAGPLAQPVRASTDLTDCDYGRWTGLTHREAAARDPEPFRAWQRDPGINPPPDGETLRQVEVRVTGAVHAILRRHAGGSVVLVTHDAVIRVLVLNLLQAPLSHYASLRQDPTAVNRIEVRADGGYRIALLNSTAHLSRAA
ncbi:histidine phosphatase family protein [Metallibacterium scheffleri]|uniref:histidine phosphatase family protein n=1 Tax=Metallibacterium scheffleri TaxID=993689 RepID=UPI0023F19FEA|nr:histidine phosphatase family protein [Metallibacterium scheffleri]